MEPYFSIIIPTFNRANLLVDTIKSIQSQTFQHWELIIVDDGSTDNTRQKMAPIIDLDQRIQYHYKENEERNFARNYGVPFAKGKYILFFDSDDWMLSHNLESLYKASNCNSPIISSGVIQQNKQVDIKKRYEDSGSSSITEFLCKYNILLPSTIFRRDIVEFPFFFPDKKLVRGEDNLILILLSLKYPFKLIHHIGFEINNHSNRSIYDADLNKCEYSYNRIAKLLREKLDYRNLTLVRVKNNFHLLNVYMRHKKWLRAFFLLIKTPTQYIEILKKHKYWYHWKLLIRAILVRIATIILPTNILKWSKKIYHRMKA